MKAVPGILPTLLEMICFFSTPTIDVEPNFKSFSQTIVQNTKYDIIEQTGEETDVLSLRTNERVCVFDCAHRRKNYEKR